MASENDNTPYVQVHIETIDGYRHADIKCTLSQSINSYSQYAEAAYENGLLRHEGWFTVIDLEGYFHAFPLSQIRRIVCKLVMFNE